MLSHVSLGPHGPQPARLLCPWNFPGKNTGVGCHFLLQRDHWDNIKHTNIHIIRVLEGEDRERGPEKIFAETMDENFLNMEKQIFGQIQEAREPQAG